METQTQYRDVKTAVATVFQRTSSREQAIFRKEGEYWSVGCGGNSFRLKDTKGLGYLAHLLRHPATEFHVLDLAGGIAGQHDNDEAGESAHGLPRGNEDLEKAGIHVGSLGDAGEMLDEQAKVAYRQRLSELREELEEAKELGKVERAEQAEEEIDALTRELSRAVGLGGRKSTCGVSCVSFGTSPTEHHQDDQGGGGKDRAERCPAGTDLRALHQDGQLLQLPARLRFPDRVGIRCDHYRESRPSNLRKWRVRSSAYHRSPADLACGA